MTLHDFVTKFGGMDVTQSLCGMVFVGICLWGMIFPASGEDRSKRVKPTDQPRR